MSDLDKYINSVYDDVYVDPEVIQHDVYMQQQNEIRSGRDKKIQSYIDSVSYDITSRDQIVNPEWYLSGFEFENTEEDRAIYNKFLAALRNVQTQQTAVFEEWYNSTSQQVLRDKAAGLNPDILGVQGTQAGQAGVLEGSPYDGLMTQEQIDMQRMNARTQRIQSFVSFISSLASVASLPAQFTTAFAGAKVAKEQADSLHLGNIKSFEDLVSNEISSRLSDAVSSAVDSGQSLDIASWFGDENNFAGLLDYSPDGSLPYQNSLAKVRNRMQRSLSAAYEQGAITAENRKSFASMLADPTNDTDLLIQAAHLRPYMEAQRELQLARDKYEKSLADWKKKYQDGLDVDSAIAAANAENDYNSAYYEEMDAEKMALWKMYQEEALGIAAKMETSINKNLQDMYDRNSSNMKGYAAAYCYAQKTSMDWYEFLAAQEIMYSPDGSVPAGAIIPESGEVATGSALHDYFRNPTGVGRVPQSALFAIPPGAAVRR